MSHDQIREISLALEQTLADFAIEARVTQVTQGPVCTRFELKPAPGVKITRIVSLQSDIAMALSAHSVRILAPIPGKSASLSLTTRCSQPRLRSSSVIS